MSQDSAPLRALLPAVGDNLRTELSALAIDPARAGAAAMQLRGALVLVDRIREASASSPGDRDAHG